MQRTRKALIKLITISIIMLSFNGYAEVVYPANPGVDDTAIYLSDVGISKINTETMETEWSVLTHKQTFEPVVTTRHVIVGSSTGMYILDKSSGAIISRVQIERTLFSPVVEDNMAYVGSKSGLFQAINLQTGEILWSRTFEGWVYPPALVGETLIVGGNRPNLTALDKATGKIIWKKQISQELVYRPVRIDHDRVVISTFGNETQLINSKNGNVIWTFRNKVPSFSPIGMNNEIVFGTLDGRLQSVNISNGKLLWEYKMGGYLSIQAYPTQGAIMISNNQGMIVKVNANNGLVEWQKRISSDLVGVPILLKEDVIVFRSKKFNTSSSVEIFDSSQKVGGHHES